MALTFKGGVLVGIRKKAASKEIEQFAPARVLLPFTEDCTLTEGDSVALGQPIGTDRCGIRRFASVAGKITEIKELGTAKSVWLLLLRHNHSYDLYLPRRSH